MEDMMGQQKVIPEKILPKVSTIKRPTKAGLSHKKKSILTSKIRKNTLPKRASANDDDDDNSMEYDTINIDGDPEVEQIFDMTDTEIENNSNNFEIVFENTEEQDRRTCTSLPSVFGVSQSRAEATTSKSKNV
jgi:hypothetical protein